MKPLLLILSSFLLVTASAQKREEFFSYQFKPTKSDYYYYVTTEKQDSLWRREAYYTAQKTEAMNGWYKDEAGNIEHGLFTWFHPSRLKWMQGRYAEGKREGIWLTWSEKGTLIDSSVYTAGKRLGISKRWYENGKLRDSSNFDTAGNGTLVSWHNDGVLSQTSQWIHDTVKSGQWKYYHRNGQLMATEDFNNGKKALCTCYDEKGTQLDSAFCAETAATPASIKEWRRFLETGMAKIIERKSRVFPPGQYTVPVRFTVEADGSLSNFTALSRYGQGLEEEAIAVLKDSPPLWTPARRHGRFIKSTKTQPVTFQIQANSRNNGM